MGNRHARPKPDHLAPKLRQVREFLGLNLEEMAEALKRAKKSPPSKASIYRFERGEREPSLLVLLEYSRIAGTSVEILIDDNLDLPKRIRTKRKP
jgi:transcriptional regulator with XRE-family HTH domain